MKAGLVLIFVASLASAASEEKIYKCAVDGKIIITNLPCDGKKPEPTRKKTPEYEKAVVCGMVEGLENLGRVLTGNEQRHGCNDMKK